MESFVNTLNSIIWSPVLVGLCLCAGLFFSIRSRFVQIRMIPEMWRLIFQKKEDDIGLSSFQALTMTLASRVGTGNIAGVATAICFGGPGALFWMWMVAFLGASSAFVESTLGQIYKEKIDGQYRGGPAFYIEKGLNCKPYAWAYIVVAVIIVGINYEQIPHVLGLIFSSAFGMGSILGGMLGAAISWGVKRGIYSNEAGQGTAPHASSAAAVSHPVKQGLVQAFSVYIDTLFVCTATGLMVLMTGCYNIVDPNGAVLHEGLPGVEAGPVYTQLAIDQLMPGWGGPFIAIAIFFFAFTTILGYYYMAETNTAYLNRTIKKPILMLVVKVVFLGTVAFGTLRASSLIWAMADVGVGMMAYLNLIAILLLQGIAFKALRDYEQQKNQQQNPTFHPEVIHINNASYWNKNRAEKNLALEEHQ